MVGSTRHPDFEATRAGAALYLEATVTAPSPEKVGADTCVARLIGEINHRIPVEDFSLNLLVEQAGPADVPIRELCEDIRARLVNFDAEQLAAWDEQPCWSWVSAGWELIFTARALPRVHRHDGGRIIGSHGPGVHLIEDVAPILSALNKKATRYGRKLGRPYVITVDPAGYPDSDDVLQALFGPWELHWPNPEPEAGSPIWARRPRGLWRNAAGPAMTHVSAILTTDDLWPWTVAKSVPTVSHHPGADHPLIHVPPVANQVRFLAGVPDMQYMPAVVEPATFFGLAPGWPHFAR